MELKTKKTASKALSYFINITYLFVIITFAASTAFGIIRDDAYNVVDLNDGWTDESGAPFALNNFNKSDGTRMLPQRAYKLLDLRQYDSTIVFRCRNCYMNVYIDGRLVHKDYISDPLLYGKSPGSRWHTVSVGTYDAPVEVCLEVTACFGNSKGLIDNIYMGNALDVYRRIVIPRFFIFTISTFLSIAGILLVILYFYLKRRVDIRRDFLFLGLTTFFSAQWTSMESLLWQLFWGHSELFHFLTYISFLAIPLSYSFLAGYQLKGRFKKLADIFSFICAANLIISTLLHVTGVLEFHYTIVVGDVLVGLSIPLIIKLASSYAKKSKEERENVSKDFVSIVLIAVLVICIITALVKYLTGSYSDYSSYICVALMCFLSYLIISQMNQLVTAFSKGVKADIFHDLALTDHLTGLFNRTAFNEHRPDYEHMIDSFSPIGIIQFDVNNLKTVNDTLGHEKGNQMIKAVADGLKQTFADNCNSYRTGGDEFLTIINCMNPDEIYETAIKQFMDYCEEYSRQPDLGFTLKVAHGYTLIKGNMSLSEAMDEADALMYENKKMLKGNQAIR